jgi:hypothetical protein
LNNTKDILAENYIFKYNNIDIPVYGFKNDNTKITLYIHNKGLGLTDNINNTINDNNFIQLDLSNLAQYIKPKTIPNISIVSMFSQEAFKIYGTNTLDRILGTLIYESDSNNIIQNIPIPLFGVYKYIQITSDNSDILLESIYFICNLDINNKICANTCLCEPYCTCEPICKCGTNKYIEDIKLQDPILTDNNIIENNDIIDNTKQDNNKQDNNKQDNTKQDNNKQNNTKQKNNIKENNIII